MEDGHAEHSHRHGGRGIGLCRQRRGRARQQFSRAAGFAAEVVDACERRKDRAAGQARSQTRLDEADENGEAFPPPRNAHCGRDGKPGINQRAGADSGADANPAPTSWSAQAAIDAAPPSIWPAGNAPTFAGVLDAEPQVASTEPSLSSDQNAAPSNAVADPQPDPAVAAALEDDSNDSRDAWFEEILATLSGALAAGAVAWFLFGAAPRRRYG